MQRGSTLFLKIAVSLLGLGVLAICVLGLPRILNVALVGMYYPILLGLYVPAIPFFVALYQSLLLLHYIDKNIAFSSLSIKSLGIIKYCAIAISLLFGAGMPYISYVAEQDDAPGVILIGLIIIFASSVIATFAALLQKLLYNAVEIKEENDLTV